MFRINGGYWPCCNLALYWNVWGTVTKRWWLHFKVDIQQKITFVQEVYSLLSLVTLLSFLNYRCVLWVLYCWLIYAWYFLWHSCNKNPKWFTNQHCWRIALITVFWICMTLLTENTFSIVFQKYSEYLYLYN